MLDTDTLQFTYEAQSAAVPFSTNGEISMQPDQDFVQAELSDGMDTIWIHVSENDTGSPRQAEVVVEGCHGSTVIAVFQEEGVIDRVDQAGAGELVIYPNPVDGNRIQVVLPESGGTCDYTITDLTGRTVQQGKIYHQRSSIPVGFKSGSYLLQVTGNQLHFQKTIIVM
jgi:hypothetical protein